MDGDQAKEVKVKPGRLGLGRRLLLVAGLPGVEGSSTFISLFLIPVLQTLGMPLRLASMTGFISGPLGIVLVPLLGWLSDRGSNPIRRKRGVVLAATMAMTLGLTLVVVVCSVYTHPPDTHMALLSNTTNTTTPSVIEYVYDAEHASTQVTIPHRHFAGPGKETNDATSPGNSSFHTLGAAEYLNSSDKYSNSSGTLSHPPDNNQLAGDRLAAGLAMFGFILFECGYSQAVTSVRSWVVACSPRGEHTSLLVLAIMVAAVGGMSNAALGRVNFPAMFRLDADNESGHPPLLVQAAVQAVITILLLVVGMALTLFTGHKMSRNNVSEVTTIVEQDSTTVKNDSDSVMWGPSDEHLGASRTGETADAVTDDRSKDEIASDDVVDDRCTDGKGPLDSLLSHSCDEKSDEKAAMHEAVCVTTNEHNACEQNSVDDLDIGYDTTLNDTLRHRGVLRHCRNSYYGNLAPICVGMYFTCGGMYCYSFMVSDYVGKAVYGGDPHADAGSESVGLYTAGVRTAAWGFLTFSSVYMLINLLHTRILTLLGYKLEFVLVQLLTGGSMVLLALTARLELFFLLSVAVGLYRAALYVVPFAAANDVVQKMVKDSKTSGSRPRVGLAMSVVGCMIPLSYTTLFPWMGPLTEYTGVHATPLWVGALFTCLAAAGFMLVKTDVGPKCPVKC